MNIKSLICAMIVGVFVTTAEAVENFLRLRLARRQESGGCCRKRFLRACGFRLLALRQRLGRAEKSFGFQDERILRPRQPAHRPEI